LILHISRMRRNIDVFNSKHELKNND